MPADYRASAPASRRSYRATGRAREQVLCGSVPSYHHQMPRLGTANGAKRYAAVQRRQPPIVFHREREQIRIGDLIWSKNAHRIENIPVGDRNVVGPKRVVRMLDVLGETRDRLGGGHRFRIGVLGENAREAILRQRTGCPAVPLVRLPSFPARARNEHDPAGTAPAERSRQTTNASSGIFLKPRSDHLRRDDLPGSRQQPEAIPVARFIA